MKDTQVEVEQKYREMLLARSGEERLRIGCSMHATAQALVRAFVLAENPLASPGELRRALFLRFYGHEFDASARERIAARLDRDAPSTHTSRRVPVNWDDLEMALTRTPGSGPATSTRGAEDRCGSDLISVAVFGSRVRGTAKPDSGRRYRSTSTASWPWQRGCCRGSVLLRAA